MKNKILEFFETEASGGILLGIAALMAFAIANSSISSFYFSALEIKILGLSLQYWVNDGLMAIFFFHVGLEIKKELAIGHLSTPKKASFPIFAALGGMIIPALIYTFLNPSLPQAKGWGIPMATDIAFAIGVLALFGKKIPLSLKVFLLAVAIVDDLGAILVIAFFYTNEINGNGLALASLALGVASLLKYSGVKSYLVYIVIGVTVWVGFLLSGIHATIAGVLLGLLTPIKFPTNKKSEKHYSPLDELIHKIHPWVSYGIMPIFAFSNAGVVLRGVDFLQVIVHPISLGITFGLFIGKPLGVFGVSYIFSKLKIISIPEGVNWGQILGVGFLAGIGFTMSLFISNLALTSDLEIYSKSGIIFGSILSAFVGSLVIRKCI